MIKRSRKKRAERVDLETLLSHCLTRDRGKMPPLEKVFTSSEIEKLDTDTWEILYLSLSRVIGEREKPRPGQAQTIEEMLGIWGELLDEEDKQKNLILRGNLIRLAGRLGEDEYIYCPHSGEFKGSPLSRNLHEFKGLEEWLKDKIFSDIQKEIIRLSSLVQRERGNIEELINSWVDFYNFLYKVKLGHEERRDLYSQKIKMASPNIDDETLKKDMNTFLCQVPSADKLKGMEEILFYQLSRNWNSIFLSLLECQVKIALSGRKKKEEAPVSKLLHKWRELGEDIGKGGESEEVDFQKKKKDIVYYTTYISYFLSAPAELTSNIFHTLSWFVDSRRVINAPAHRIHYLRDEWNRVWLLLERFQAEKELVATDKGKDILFSLEKLLPLWSEFEELIRAESYEEKDEGMFADLRVEILKAYSPISSVTGVDFLNQRNLLSYPSLSQIRNLPSRKELLRKWHEHYVRFHIIFDDCLIKGKELDFELIRDSLGKLIDSWQKLGVFLAEGEGELVEIRKEVYEQFKIARRDVPILSGEGVKIMNFLASLPSGREGNRMSDPEKRQAIIGWDRILTGLYFCQGEAEALKDRQQYEKEEKRYKNKLLKRKRLKKKLPIMLLIIIFLSGTGILYRDYSGYRKEFRERLTYRPWQKKATPVNYSFKSMRNGTILKMVKAPDKLWVLTEDGNLEIYPLGTTPLLLQEGRGRKETIPIPLHSQPRCIYVDSNFVWVGTQEGVLRLDKLTRVWDHLGDGKGLDVKNITAIVVNNRRMWIGTNKGKDWEGGIVSYNTLSGETHRYTKKDGLPGDDITALEVVGNSIWAGTKAGVGIYDLGKKKWKKILRFGSINCIALDGSFVWLGGLGKVYVLDMNKGIWKTYLLKEGLGYWINDIFVQKDYVWLATGGTGLIRYNKYDNAWESFDSKRNKLLNDSLQNVCGQMDRIWVSSAALFGGGIIEIKAGKVE